MANAKFDNYYPHTLKVDELIEEEQKKNNNRKNLQNLNQVDDYLCVFENIGIEYPEAALGLKYRSSTTKRERKNLCENKGRDGAGVEGLIYIKKEDWINPDEVEYECGVFNMDDTRKTYAKTPTNDPRKFPSKQLCDKYYHKNEGNQFYTKMVSSKLKTPAIDLRAPDIDDKYKKDAKNKLFWITYIIAISFFIMWTFKYNTQRPYAFYDYIQSIFVNKSMYLIVLFGIYVYLFCPFDTCYHDPDTPLYRRDFNRFAKESICDYTNHNIPYIEEGVCTKYDNSPWLKKFDSIIGLFLNLNRKIERPLKYINSSICNYCEVDYPCIDRRPYNSLFITKPTYLTVYSNDLKNDSDSLVRNAANIKNYFLAINIKYKYKKIGSTYSPYDTGTIIYLRTDDDLDKVLLMSCLSINDDKTNNISTIDGPDYSYSWIYVRDRKGLTIFNDKIDDLRLKVCPYSFRIFSVDTNYELLGYNIALSEAAFVLNFEKNAKDYKAYPYYPAFDILKLKQYINKKPDFIKRKLISIYRYLTNKPSQKIRTKNITILGGNILRYDITSSKLNVNNTILNDYYLKNNLYMKQCNNYIQKFNEINDYHNDDEDEKEYLNFYNNSHQAIAKDFYLTSNYKLDLESIYNKIKINSENEDLDDVMYNLNMELYNLNYIQRSNVRKNINNKIIENFHNIRKPFIDRSDPDIFSQLEYIYKNKNVNIHTSPSIIIKDGKYKISINETLKLEEIVNEHNFQKKKYVQDGILNECIYCKQVCKM
jgi:hypothetical protein